MYKLYYFPNNASLAPHLILHYIGCDFSLQLVDKKQQWQKSAEYLKLNPAGRIPCLTNGDFVLFESAAICNYLAEKHPEAALIPNGSIEQSAIYQQWMMYLTNTLQAELMVFYYAARHTLDERHVDTIRLAQHEQIAKVLTIIDNHLADRTYFLGEQLSACDFFFVMLAEWCLPIARNPMTFTNIGRYLNRMAQLDSVIAVFDKEGIDLTPFQS